jgi:ubiquinone/menaquinone biosynthesis C-methylase UbiE
MADSCCIEKCDIFDFMAHFVGMSVLHPGGFAATQKLAEACKINCNSKVIDIACGKGTSAIYLAEKYGCSVEGVEISEQLVDEARKNAQQKGLNNLVKFQVGDAVKLPFSDNQFDIAVSQAMLVLIEDQKKVIQEAMRIVKPGGRAGWLELSWQKEPSQEFFDIVANKICAYCMLNVKTYEGWQGLFSEAGAKQLDTIKFANNPKGGLRSMFTDEGVLNFLKIMFKYVSNSQIRKRMQLLNKFFQAYDDCFGYGIYVVNK